MKMCVLLAITKVCHSKGNKEHFGIFFVTLAFVETCVILIYILMSMRQDIPSILYLEGDNL